MIKKRQAVRKDMKSEDVACWKKGMATMYMPE
jgi:hypothetical protein